MTTPTPVPPPVDPFRPSGPVQIPVAYVDLKIQGNQMTHSIAAPTVTVNGWPTQLGYGRHLLTVPPGPVRVDVEAQWMRTYGQATAEFTIAPGQTIPVFYASPHHQFSRGSIGHVRQRRRGVFGLLLILLAAFASAVAVSLAAVYLLADAIA